MGRLFENFETYDVQETRRIAREEARKEAQEEGIRILIRTNEKHEITKKETVAGLMETYHLSAEEAHKP